jgi:hypothetical protein
MNILMLADVFYPDTVGGSGRVAYHLGLELSKKGHEVHIVKLLEKACRFSFDTTKVPC